MTAPAIEPLPQILDSTSNNLSNDIPGLLLLVLPQQLANLRIVQAKFLYIHQLFPLGFAIPFTRLEWMGSADLYWLSPTWGIEIKREFRSSSSSNFL